MAGYADVIVLRHPEPGAVAVSCIFPKCEYFTGCVNPSWRVRFLLFYSEQPNTVGNHCWMPVTELANIRLKRCSISLQSEKKSVPSTAWRLRWSATWSTAAPFILSRGSSRLFNHNWLPRIVYFELFRNSKTLRLAKFQNLTSKLNSSTAT